MTKHDLNEKTDLMNLKNLLIFTGFMSILLIVGIVVFGIRVLYVALISYAVSLILEYAFSKIRKKPLDISVMVTPLIFTLLMPPTIPLWIAGVGSGFGTLFGKNLFGGHGKNIFNPAVVGVLFVTISFPLFLNAKWLDPTTNIISDMTPLIAYNRGQLTHTFNDLVMGWTSGAIGETFRLGIIIIGGLLIVRKIIDWRIPLFYLGTVFAFMGIGYLLDKDTFGNPIMALFVGGVLFAAFFVATDPVTSPQKARGKIIYGIGLGIITVIIRVYSAFPEGVIFSIIIMNAVAALLDGEETNASVDLNVEEVSM